MKVGEDSWCPSCTEWMPHDKDGNCIMCGTFINKILKEHSWFEMFGVDPKELESMDF